MTYDSSASRFVRPIDSPVSVLTGDGSALPIATRGTLSSSSLHVPSIAHISRLTMQLFFGSQIVDSRCRVTLDCDSCSVQDRCTGTLLGAGPRCLDGLWELDWLCLPSDAANAISSAHVAASTSSFQQWHHRLGHLCGSHLSSLVHHGVLGYVSDNASLDCMDCRLGKQI
jgi:hypothetical protein